MFKKTHFLQKVPGVDGLTAKIKLRFEIPPAQCGHELTQQLEPADLNSVLFRISCYIELKTISPGFAFQSFTTNKPLLTIIHRSGGE